MRTSLTLSLAALAALGVAAPTSFAGTINVPADFPTIQAAINAAIDGDVINIAKGTYKENVDLGTKNLTLQGQGDHVVQNTTLNGSNGGSCITIAGGQDSTTVITGLTIKFGNGTLIGTKRYGGGIYIANASSPTITENRIGFNGKSTGANSAFQGGGIFVSADSHPLIQFNLIANNFTSPKGAGGGLYAGGDLVIDGNRFAENGSVNGTGGGAYLTGVSATCTNNTFSQNFAFYGGGLQVHGSSPLVSGNLFERNTVLSAPLNGEGAGLAITGKSSPLVTGNEMMLNTAHNGGGIYVHSSSPTIVGNLVHDNQATLGLGFGGGVSFGKSGGTFDLNEVYLNTAGQGAGISARGGTTTTMLSVLIDHNSAVGGSANGGGIYTLDSTIFVAGTTIADNSATNGGGVHANGTVAPTLDTVIIWGNTAPNFPSIQDNTGVMLVSFSDVENILIGGSSISVDPLFTDPAARDYRVQAGSAVIDQGNFSLNPPGTDLGGNARVNDGDGDGSPRIDMGAYEF